LQAVTVRSGLTLSGWRAPGGGRAKWSARTAFGSTMRTSGSLQNRRPGVRVPPPPAADFQRTRLRLVYRSKPLQTAPAGGRVSRGWRAATAPRLNHERCDGRSASSGCAPRLASTRSSSTRGSVTAPCNSATLRWRSVAATSNSLVCSTASASCTTTLAITSGGMGGLCSGRGSDIAGPEFDRLRVSRLDERAQLHAGNAIPLAALEQALQGVGTGVSAPARRRVTLAAESEAQGAALTACAAIIGHRPSGESRAAARFPGPPTGFHDPRQIPSARSRSFSGSSAASLG
jgi:hypothetical protein